MTQLAKKGKYLDPFLEKRLVKYDAWLNKGQISCSSKVIPISASFNTKQWVASDRAGDGNTSQCKIGGGSEL